MWPLDPIHGHQVSPSLYNPALLSRQRPPPFYPVLSSTGLLHLGFSPSSASHPTP